MKTCEPAIIAYSDEFGHLFRGIPAICSEIDRPFRRSEVTLVFCYISEFVLLVKDECDFFIDSPMSTAGKAIQDGVSYCGIVSEPENEL